ncbi:hypothetical protein GCM10010531_27830 [Blastococcus jejuensis]|uniref:Uncharacterized protein n=1 Tax=Blastococcus jejuensis TaxID=351224 RepID=A0ABP6PB64_9ACTN
MTWTKLSDDYSDDCWTLSDAAFRLHTEALVWNNRKLLDLRIPKADLRRFAKTPEAAPELLAVGWWSDDGDAYVIRHHGTYQRTREQVLAQQTANAENGRRGGRPRKPREISEMPSSTQETQSVSESVSESKTESGTQRDRTGQGRTGSYGSGQESDWPSVVCTTSGHPGCGWQHTDKCPDCCSVVAR